MCAGANERVNDGVCEIETYSMNVLAVCVPYSFEFFAQMGLEILYGYVRLFSLNLFFSSVVHFQVPSPLCRNFVSH